jgi:hypothetical protein
MAEERESQKSHAKGEPDVEGHGQVGAQAGAQSGAPDVELHGQAGAQAGAQSGAPDVELHGQAPMTDDSDPDELKTKLANDEGDDVEAHANNPAQTP